MRYLVARLGVLLTVALTISAPAFGAWEKEPGALSQIAVGKNAWGVAPDGTIWYWGGSNWVKIDGTVSNIANGADGALWGVQASGYVYERTGYQQWTLRPGTLSQIAVGNASNIWGIAPDDTIYKWNGSNWDNVEGHLMWIAVANNGTVWGVQRGGNLFRRDGGSWTYIAGGMSNVSVNGGQVWAVSAAGEVFRMNGNTPERMMGTLKQIAVGPDGALWGVTGSGEVYYGAPGSVLPNPAYVAVGNGKSYLGVNQYIKTGEYLAADNKLFYATVQSDGNFCVYRGDSVFNFGLVWCSQKLGGGGQFFALQQNDGNFCVYAGTGPNDKVGALWCTGATASGGGFFTIVQNDGNLVTYRGTGPTNNLGILWNSAVTTSATGPIQDASAYRIRSKSLYWGEVTICFTPTSRCTYSMRATEIQGTVEGAQLEADRLPHQDRFLPFPDMTLRPARNPSLCVAKTVRRQTSSEETVITLQRCQSPPTPAQYWEFERKPKAWQQIKQAGQCLLHGDPSYGDILTVGDCAREEWYSWWLFEQ